MATPEKPALMPFYPSRIGVERERGPTAAEIERQFRRAWLDSEDENVTLH